MMVRYEIKEHSIFGHALYSHTKIKDSTLPGGYRWGGGEASNYVCAGSLDYCNKIKERLEAAQ